MTIKDLVKKNRSYRRFDGSHAVGEDVLRELVETARLTASGANKQPLKFFLSSDKELNSKIYQNLAWAGYLKDWDGPEPPERPAGYITILLDKTIAQSALVDHGIAAQTILLAASEKGLGGCMLFSIKKKELGAVLQIDEEKYEILMVIALGKPVEKVVLEETGPEGDIKYYRDPDGTHHVPKRPLDQLIIS